MLTVRFDRLGDLTGKRLLDMGCGGGRHAFEAWRRGAIVVALDYDFAELKHVCATAGAMAEAGEVAESNVGGAVNGDALNLPFPDNAFDFIICSEVLEHLWADEAAIREFTRILRPGGRMVVTVPTRWPERINWALSDSYHDQPGGHIRIYRQPELEHKLERAGLLLRGSHHAHALHSPYWWLRSAFGVDRPDHPITRTYHKLLVWDIVKGPKTTRVAEKVLSPLMGKSLIIYTEKAPAWMRPRETVAGGASE